MAMAANPCTPPKFDMMASSSSAVCGMLTPPLMLRPTNMSMALASILFISRLRARALRHFLQISCSAVLQPDLWEK